MQYGLYVVYLYGTLQAGYTLYITVKLPLAQNPNVTTLG